MSLRIVIDPGVIQDYPTLAVGLGVNDFMTAQPRNELGQFNPRPYGHAIPDAGYFVVQICNGTTTFFDGPLTPQQVAAIPACATDTNAATVRQKALAILAIPSAQRTNAQRDAVINALVRLALGQFDSDT